MDNWQTYTFEFVGGLLSNLSPLQHGVNAPGSARILRNFEPSVDGGYRRLEGFDKYDSAFVPMYGSPVVQGSSQTGTTLLIANLFVEPSEGDTFTISGVSGTYTIDVGGVSYSSSNKSATLTLTTSLASSPADQAAVSFSNKTSLIRGIVSWQDKAIAFRDNTLYESTGSGWTKINTPSYGTVLVNGGSQTGTSLAIDGLTETPNVGDTFTIAGVEKAYTVTVAPTVAAGGTTLTINPALASSPADNAAITWTTLNYSTGTKLRTEKYRLNGVEYVAGVDGYNYPFKWDGTTFSLVNQTTDIFGAEFVVFFKNQMFFAKGSRINFTAPFTDNDFLPANGAGVLSVDGTITGMLAFKDKLIIFTEKSIHQLTGNTSSDFVLQPITNKLGCVASDTIQEIGGDIMFLGPDGIRTVSATDTYGDVSMGSISKSIQSEITSLTSSSSSFSSIVVKKKSQYRLFGYNSSVNTQNAKGILGTQVVSSSGAGVGWAETVGIKSYVADADYLNATETLLFANDSGYVYQMESGNSFDGDNIIATFSTPYVYINDARIRKTFYRLNLYTDPQGSLSSDINLKFDFDTAGSIQPSSINISNSTSSVDFYGSNTAIFGTTTYGSKLKRVFSVQTIGSGFFVSLQFVSNGISPPFSLDAATIEFSSHDRR